MAVVGSTEEGGVLETTDVISAQTAIILYVGGERSILAELELTGNLGVGATEELASEVEVDEVIPRTPRVGFELLERDGDFLTVRLLIGIDVTAEVVVQLDVLGAGREGCYSHQGKN